MVELSNDCNTLSRNSSEKNDVLTWGT